MAALVCSRLFEHGEWAEPDMERNMTCLPTLKPGDLLRNPANGNTVRVAGLSRGKEYDEPLYRLQGSTGVLLAGAYTAEELADAGYALVPHIARTASTAECSPRGAPYTTTNKGEATP